ncbi:MAG: hypothetical protein KIT72_07930 [Polyangiaceae bacterium]|nr:hypothetical protein [Polyangiaceae bacterium]MCW5790334.1 hypothetical protein [Polyangiaceae bacterium]
MNFELSTFVIGIGAIAAVVIGLLLLVTRFYRKVDQGQALIVNTMRAEPIVTFTGKVVIPVFHRAEVMDISVKSIDLDRRGQEGLICKDNIRADIKVTFFVRVNKTSQDVLKVAQSIGSRRASHQDTLEQLFNAKFGEALKTVGKWLEFEELYTKREEFRDRIIEVIGKDLNGFVLEDAAIDYLEQTSLASLDPSNILDSQGIRKITEMTAHMNVKTNELKQEERKAIHKKNVEAQETILELERQQADAEAKQQREIATLRAREEAETLKIQAEERRRWELARIKQEEEVAIQNENRLRQVEVAQKNRERVVGVESERVEKDRALEAISREREVELQRIEKEKALEVERKHIADVVAARIAVEKSVAEEEERIKDLRVIAEAKRLRESVVISAEAAAQEKVTHKLKEAEAEEVAARHQAKRTLTLAEADFEASDKQARAKIRLAEATQAEVAAAGLAEVKVKEADAIAIEKVGTAQARITLETMQAEAKGEEEKGMVTVRLRNADAEAVERVGKAEALAKREMLLAEAQGEESKGLAAAKIKEADAAATEKLGAAEAVAIREKMSAEAVGLREKAAAMQALDPQSRAHEEYRLRIDKATEVELAALQTRQQIAEHQAKVLGSAMGQAKINIVGGDGQFLDRFFKTVSLGVSADGALDQSDSLKSVFREYLDGDASLREDVKQVLSSPGFSSEALKNLSIAGVLHKLMGELSDEERPKLAALLERAKELGLK